MTQNLYSVSIANWFCITSIAQSCNDFSQNLICLIGELINFTDFNDWFRVYLYDFLGSLDHGNGESCLNRASNTDYKRKCLFLDLSPIVFSIALVKKQNMRSHFSSTYCAFVIFSSWVICLKMMFIAPYLLTISMNVVVFIFIILGFNVEIIDILCCQNDFFAHF